MLKQSIIFNLLFFIGFGGLNAQSNYSKVEFGLGISPCVSWVHSNTKFTKPNGIGNNFGFGAKIIYNVNEKYGLGFDFNLQNTSANIHFDKIDVAKPGDTNFMHSSNLNISYTFKYLELPVLLKMRTDERNKIRYYGEFGGVLNILFNQRANINSAELNLESVNTRTPEDADNFKLRNTDNINTSYKYNAAIFRLGLLFGAGIQYHILNESRLDAGLRYNAGLTDIMGDTKLQIYSNYLSLNIGFIF